MGLGNPIFLYAFGGLLVPLAIHLWSRNTRTTVAFGSLRFIAETDTKTVRNFLPSELLLLMLRMLLLTCLIMMLCAPFIYQQPTKKTAYLIDQSLNETKAKIEQALPEDAIIYSFDLSSHSENKGEKDFWSALASFRQYDSLVVFSPGYLTDFKGNRPESLLNINWINTTPETQPDVKSIVLKNGHSENFLITAKQSSSLVNYKRTATKKPASPFEINIFFKTDSAYKKHENLLRSALLAIEQTSLVSVRMSDYQADRINEDDWLIWLSGTKPVTIRRNLIYVSEQDELLRQRSEGVYSINEKANVADFISQSLPLKLENILTDGSNQSLGFDDLRQISESQFFGNSDQTVITKEQIKESITHWFLIGFILLLLTERTFSALQYRK